MEEHVCHVYLYQAHAGSSCAAWSQHTPSAAHPGLPPLIARTSRALALFSCLTFACMSAQASLQPCPP
eukprot:1147533-Pelagomonas_calceolata.AAC.3